MFQALHTALERMELAWKVLAGKVAANSETLTCSRNHLEVGQVAVAKDRIDDLEKASAELIFARGFVARVEDMKYGQALEKVLP